MDRKKKSLCFWLAWLFLHPSVVRAGECESFCTTEYSDPCTERPEDCSACAECTSTSQDEKEDEIQDEKEDANVPVNTLIFSAFGLFWNLFIGCFFWCHPNTVAAMRQQFGVKPHVCVVLHAPFKKEDDPDMLEVIHAPGQPIGPGMVIQFLKENNTVETPAKVSDSSWDSVEIKRANGDKETVPKEGVARFECTYTCPEDGCGEVPPGRYFCFLSPFVLVGIWLPITPIVIHAEGPVGIVAIFVGFILPCSFLFWLQYKDVKKEVEQGHFPVKKKEDDAAAQRTELELLEAGNLATVEQAASKKAIKVVADYRAAAAAGPDGAEANYEVFKSALAPEIQKDGTLLKLLTAEFGFKSGAEGEVKWPKSAADMTSMAEWKDKSLDDFLARLQDRLSFEEKEEVVIQVVAPQEMGIREVAIQEVQEEENIQARQPAGDEITQVSQ